MRETVETQSANVRSSVRFREALISGTVGRRYLATTAMLFFNLHVEVVCIVLTYLLIIVWQH